MDDKKEKEKGWAVMALDACRSLCAAYKGGGSMDWADVDAAWLLAKKAIEKARGKSAVTWQKLESVGSLLSSAGWMIPDPDSQDLGCIDIDPGDRCHVEEAPDEFIGSLSHADFQLVRPFLKGGEK